MPRQSRSLQPIAHPTFAYLAISAALFAATSGCSSHQRRQNLNRRITQVVHEHTHGSLERFGSERELGQYTQRLGRLLAAREQLRQQWATTHSDMLSESSAPASAVADDSDEGITNNQEQGVDEGGIIKAYGDYLVVLRRGRLFSMKLEGDELRAISAVDTSPPGSDHQGWYDEMLLHDGTIVVVGYSYEASATELGLFDIDEEGVISHRETFYLTSADYFSSRNYASRLVGNTLIFYMPYPLLRGDWDGDRMTYERQLPGVRRHGEGDWDTIIEATEIYRPIQGAESPVLHTVVSCDLSLPQVSCNARGVLGPSGRNFYVSRDAVWLWVSGGYSPVGSSREEIQASPAVAYRLPLDGSAPGALGVWGSPTDQFSFRESPDGHLNVLVRAEGAGDMMWGPESTSGDVALFRTPVSAFTTRAGHSQADDYRQLPRPDGYVFNNRFVGEHLLYGTGSGWGYHHGARQRQVYVYPYTLGPEAIATPVTLPHGVDRIEVMGDSSVVIGSDGSSLHFSAIELQGLPSVAGSYVQPGVGQGELRSHGFFYKPQRDGTGLLGLPVRHASQPGYAHLTHGSAEVMFLRVEGEREFSRLGALAARPERVDDQCRVSCVDWYGNARPIFYRGRTFALLGYELVEGAISDGNLSELRRGNFLHALLRPALP